MLIIYDFIHIATHLTHMLARRLRHKAKPFGRVIAQDLTPIPSSCSGGRTPPHAGTGQCAKRLPGGQTRGAFACWESGGIGARKRRSKGAINSTSRPWKATLHKPILYRRPARRATPSTLRCRTPRSPRLLWLRLRNIRRIVLPQLRAQFLQTRRLWQAVAEFVT